MTKLIFDTDKALFSALGLMTQARGLMADVAAQDADSYPLADSLSLLDDSISQINGELRARQDRRAA